MSSLFERTFVDRDTVLKWYEDGVFDEKCGICEKPGARNLWFSPISDAAHFECQVQFLEIEKKLFETINSLFHENYHRNSAHIEAIRAVKNKTFEIANKCSLMNFLVKLGEEKLTEIFNTTGIEGAKSYNPNSSLFL